MTTKTICRDDWLRFLAACGNEEEGQGITLIESAHLFPKVRKWFQGSYAKGCKVNGATPASIGLANEVRTSNPSNFVKLLKNWYHARFPRVLLVRVAEFGIVHSGFMIVIQSSRTKDIVASDNEIDQRWLGVSPSSCGR
jgi:hypothetical protein